MRRVCWLLVAVSAMAEIANAQQVVEILADDPRSFSIELPASAFSHAGASLAVDVNGYDLTPFARLEDDTLRVQLATPLDPGQYGLSILLLLPDGDAEVLLDATLEVIAAEGMQWSANAMLQTSFRVAEEPEEAFDGLERGHDQGQLIPRSRAPGRGLAAGVRPGRHL
jgi:hypothetical protein